MANAELASIINDEENYHSLFSFGIKICYASNFRSGDLPFGCRVRHLEPATGINSNYYIDNKYVTEIDLEKKEYRDFLSFLGLPVEEERVKFNTVKKIVITKDNHSQMLNSRSRSRQIDWASFTGTLLLDENKTLKLLTKNDKNQLIKGIKGFADFLEVDVEDQTTSRHYLIDISKV